MIAGGAVAIVAILPCIVLFILSFVAPNTYRKLTKRFRKKLIELSEESGRGPVADQLRAILAEHAYKLSTPADLFNAWDDDGEGSVSRKEFRTWWPKIGYDVPPCDLNELFDEFDVDGSGEIDKEEFEKAFHAKGELWKELGDLQKQHDENQAIHRAIIELKGKIGRKEKDRAILRAAGKRLDEKVHTRQKAVKLETVELELLNTKLLEHQRRFDKLKGGFKTHMKAARLVKMFGGDPNAAAAMIQARVRGNNAQKLVAEKRSEKLSPMAASATRFAEERAARANALLQQQTNSTIARNSSRGLMQDLNARLQTLHAFEIQLRGAPPPVLPHPSKVTSA